MGTLEQGSGLEENGDGTVYERFLQLSVKEPVFVHTDVYACGDGDVRLELTPARFATRSETRDAYLQVIQAVDKEDRLDNRQGLSHAAILDLRLPLPAVDVTHPTQVSAPEVMDCYNLQVDPECSMDCQVTWDEPTTP